MIKSWGGKYGCKDQKCNAYFLTKIISLDLNAQFVLLYIKPSASSFFHDNLPKVSKRCSGMDRTIQALDVVAKGVSLTQHDNISFNLSNINEPGCK